MKSSRIPPLPRTRLSPKTRIRIERVLPRPGEILVRAGEEVRASQRIARFPKQGEIQVVNVAHILGLDGNDISRVMVKRPGDWVETGEILATRRGALPFWHKPCRAPTTGRLAAVGYGWIVIEAGAKSDRVPARQVETEDLLALVAGQVTAIENRRSVTIETVGAYIEGACGVGNDGTGVLQISVEGPNHPLTADDIGIGSNNAILVGGAGVTPEALARAQEMHVKGIISGSISASLHSVQPALPFPVVATEGYGKVPMSPMIFDVLAKLEGREVSISSQVGETWARSRPTIIVPLADEQGIEGDPDRGALAVEPARIGDRIRVVRHPLLGQLGEIATSITTPQTVPSGLTLPSAQVALAGPAYASLAGNNDGTQSGVTRYQSGAAYPKGAGQVSGNVHYVPWLNLELFG